MCPPDYFDVKYSINPWMDKNKEITNAKFKQWQTLKNKLLELDVGLEFLKPQKNCPDLVFVDAGIVYKKIFIPSNFYCKERRCEREYYVNWFRQNGFEIRQILEELFFEGHGDTVQVESKMFFGHGIRSSLLAQKEISNILCKLDKRIEIIPLRLVDERFFHLDTCFCPLDEKRAMFFPEAFSAESQKKLNQHFELIEIPKGEEEFFACNAVVVEKDVIIPANTPKTCGILDKLGFKTHPIEMSEFIKGGGACHCLSMRLG